MSDQSDQEKCNEKQENAFVKTCVEDWEELEKEYMQLEVWHFKSVKKLRMITGTRANDARPSQGLIDS